MKKAILALLVIGLSLTAFSQSKKEKELVIKVDSAHAVQFLTIWQVGYTSLLETNLTGQVIKQYQIYGDSVFRANAAIFQSWQPKPEPGKKDTTTKH